MPVQADTRFSETALPSPSCLRKGKSWQSVMEYPGDETGRNINTNDETEQGIARLSINQQQYRPSAIHRERSNNTEASASTGLPAGAPFYPPDLSVSTGPTNPPPVVFPGNSLYSGTDPRISMAGTTIYPQQAQHPQHPQHTQPAYPPAYQHPYPPLGPSAPPHLQQGHPAAYPQYLPQQPGVFPHAPQPQPVYGINTMNMNTPFQHHTSEIMGPRPPSERPIIKLSRSLLDTYKHINIIYEREQEEKKRAKEERRKKGVRNHGWDDENYDYIITPNELILDRYRVKERLGKGSFGQVVRAVDTKKNMDVAIKIIKSKKPFQQQARTEIEILTHLKNRDVNDENNIGKHIAVSRLSHC